MEPAARRRLFGLFAALVLLSPSLAGAQDRPLDKGNQLIEQGDFERALDVLLPQYAQDPTAPIAHAVARAYDALRDDPMALRFYEAATQLRPGLDGATKKRIVDRMKQLKTRLKDRPNKGTLSVRAVADGASVFLDGEQLGRTPLSGVLVKPGQHRVRVVHEHYEPWEKAITVEGYDTIALDADLVDRPTDVLIHTEPAGALARIQNGPECVTPCLVPLRAGQYAMTLQRDGYQPLTHAFTKLAGQILEVRLDLAIAGPVPLAVPAGQGLLNLVVTPPGSGIRVDRVLQGTAPLSRPIALSPGIHTLDVIMPSYRDFSAQVQVTAGETTTIAVQLQPGSLMPSAQNTPRPPTPTPTATPSWGNASPPARPVPSPFTPEPESESWRSPTGWSITGVGIAMAVAGTAVAVALPLANQSKIDNATRFKITDETGASALYISGITRADAQKLEDGGKTGLIAGAVIAGIGAAAIIAGVVILSGGPDDPPNGPADVPPGGRRNFAPPAVSISPWFDASGGGALATLVF